MHHGFGSTSMCLEAQASTAIGLHKCWAPQMVLATLVNRLAQATVSGYFDSVENALQDAPLLPPLRKRCSDIFAFEIARSPRGVDEATDYRLHIHRFAGREILQENFVGDLVLNWATLYPLVLVKKIPAVL